MTFWSSSRGAIYAALAGVVMNRSQPGASKKQTTPRLVELP
jgi:hypothetical protein